MMVFCGYRSLFDPFLFKIPIVFLRDIDTRTQQKITDRTPWLSPKKDRYSAVLEGRTGVV
jgi:hypothetical protein